METNEFARNLDKKQLNEYVGMRIKEERKRKKISQKDLASKIGVQNSTLSQYEHGKSEPNQEILFKIASALDVNASDLIPSDYRVGDNNLERALKMAKNFDSEDVALLKDLIEKALSLDEAEREKFFRDIKFAIEYYDKNGKANYR